MIVHENVTKVEAVVRHIAPCADGYGQELDLEILGNESRDPNLDYLKPKTGDLLKVFAVDPGAMQEKCRIRATLGLSAGPFGQRAVLRDVETLSPKP